MDSVQRFFEKMACQIAIFPCLRIRINTLISKKLQILRPKKKSLR